MKEICLHGNKIIQGPGSLSALKNICGRSALIVTGKGAMERTGVIKKAKEYLTFGFSKVFVHKISGINPTDKMVLEGLDIIKKVNPDCIIAIGGGSPIDCAKTMLILAENPELSVDQLPTAEIPDQRKINFVVIPSTSGTASEVTHVAVITYAEKGLKIAVKSPILRPDIAILDGEITLTMPKSICAQTGMDALTHAIESYITPLADDFTRSLSKEAIEGIVKWLPISFSNESIVSRQKVHNYQCMAGMAFSNSGLGAVHGISHAFSGIFNTPHGLANAVILPYILEYNSEQDSGTKDLLKELSETLGSDIIHIIRNMNSSFSIPEKMRDTGISKADFESNINRLVEYSMYGATSQNPVKMDTEIIRRLITDKIF